MYIYPFSYFDMSFDISLLIWMQISVSKSHGISFIVFYLRTSVFHSTFRATMIIFNLSGVVCISGGQYLKNLLNFPVALNHMLYVL